MKTRWTFEELYNSTIQFKPWRRNYTHSPKMGLTGVIPFKGTNSVLFQGFAYGLTQKSIHKQNILFSGVTILTELPNNDKSLLMDYFELKYRNQVYYIEKIDPKKHYVANRCSCADYFFTFAWYNHKKGCLYGSQPRPYHRKTTTIPPRNPQEFVGICKHLWNFYSFLRASGYTKEHHAVF